ncbi:VSP with INR [Giardia lamblia P15]|uniref:VSP with INR n=1 Tax=Giardia intestinalis (strain P15) TaxID=658858 RepID=E1F8N8_GIAIA|nr:VSP with INR [Giardia lamblia P15]
MFGRLLFAGAVLQLARTATCTGSNSAQSTKCVQEKCNVWIGGKDYCSQCSTDAELLIDGGCVPTTSDLAKKCITDNKGKCSSCGDGYFLHRGGCYQFGGEVGKLICSDPAPSLPGTTLPAGACTTCGSGYFKNPAESAANTPPCIACNDTAGDSGNTGLVGCSTCDPPISGQATCTACLEGFYGTTSCQQCDESCAACIEQGISKCTKCKSASGKEYLKITDSQTASGECVPQGSCIGTHFPVIAEKKCYFCNTIEKGGKPGCKTCNGDSSSITCSACLDGFFGSEECTPCDISCLTCEAAGKENCKSCSAETHFLASTDTKGACVSCSTVQAAWSGVANCAKCDRPASSDVSAVCKECNENFYLYTPPALGKNKLPPSCVITCPAGYFGHTATSSGIRTCQPCATANGLSPDVTGIAGCKKCTYTDSLQCDECEQGKKPSLDKTKCNICIAANCATCDSEGTCQGCNSGFLLNNGNCVESTCKTENCEMCDDAKTENEVCTVCVSKYYLTPTNQCIDDCTKIGNYYGVTEKTRGICNICTVANCKECENTGTCRACNDGFYKYGEECKPCDSSCKACSGEGGTKCTECPVGKVLEYIGTEGQCIEQCVVNDDQASGSCKKCELDIGGTKYCSQCSRQNEYPQNGICTPSTQRASSCQTGPQNGMCATCADTFLKMNGGCYETTKFPGRSVCTNAPTGGTCTSPLPGYYFNGGALTVCVEGCKTCTNNVACDTCKDGYVKLGGVQACTKCDPSCETCSGAATTCKACATGYYKTASGEGVCTSCESDSNGVTGVKGCMNCAPPSSSTGPVLCYLMKDDSTGGSTNRGGLSTGAIAGIAVAVVVVVGGLVGFLCWWFLCRGKA